MEAVKISPKFQVVIPTVEEVVDPQVIERLENEDPPETDAYVDRPLSPDEIKHLEDTRGICPNS